MWADGALTIDIWENAKLQNKGEVRAKDFKAIPTTRLKFDEIGFGQDSCDYAEDAAELDAKELADILAAAKDLAKKARAGSSRSSRNGASTVEEPRASKRRRLGNVNEDNCKSFICIFH